MRAVDGDLAFARQGGHHLAGLAVEDTQAPGAVGRIEPPPLGIHGQPDQVDGSGPEGCRPACIDVYDADLVLVGVADQQLAGRGIPGQGVGRQVQRDVGNLFPALQVQDGDAPIVVDFAAQEEAVPGGIDRQVGFLGPFAQYPFFQRPSLSIHHPQ